MTSFPVSISFASTKASSEIWNHRDDFSHANQLGVAISQVIKAEALSVAMDLTMVAPTVAYAMSGSSAQTSKSFKKTSALTTVALSF